jgi:3-isopropylmalate/(R)-2-methylmalate dehydratase small subunit
MKIVNITGNAFLLPGDDIDTDRIIPARFLECVTFDGLGDHVFEDDRKQLAGKHPFDNPGNKGCEILIAGPNFGCGSSREHAVAALQRWGIKAIVAPSFAAIFRGNATGNGLVCVDVTPEGHAQILEALKHERNFEIDLSNMVVDVLYDDGINSPYVPCTMPSADREMLTTGTWDTTATLLKAGDLIEATAAKLSYMQAA